jgi:hypothetical protein
MRTDFTGRLSFDWPAAVLVPPIGKDSDKRQPLFGRGYGLDYSRTSTFPALPESLTIKP